MKSKMKSKSQKSEASITCESLALTALGCQEFDALVPDCLLWPEALIPALYFFRQQRKL